MDRLKHLVMPCLVLALIILPPITRYTRSSVLAELHRDYVRTARSKGLVENVVFFRHVLKNAFLPIVTILGYYLTRLLGATVVIETVFAWPGLGRMAYNAAAERDYPVIMGTTMIISLFVVVTNLVVDLLYGALDPRIRYD
jgi:peptide/nickel transport system permease protein